MKMLKMREMVLSIFFLGWGDGFVRMGVARVKGESGNLGWVILGWELRLG